MKKRILICAAACWGAFLLLGMWFSIARGEATITSTPTMHFVAPTIGQCGGRTPCYTNIQDAVSAAAVNDMVYVAEGVYAGVRNTNGKYQAVFIDKSIWLQGGYDPASWESNPQAHPTILDAQGLGRVIYVQGARPTIKGFTLINGAADYGGGVYLDNSSARLDGNSIYNNTAEMWGGGVYIGMGAPIITNNHIHDNTAASGCGGGVAEYTSTAYFATNVITANTAHIGGGIYVQNNLLDQEAFFSENLVQDNTAIEKVSGSTTYDGAGGGFYIEGTGVTQVLRNTIERNHADSGGGLKVATTPAVILGNIIQENTADLHGGGLYVQVSPADINPTITNNSILENAAGSDGGGMLLILTQGDIEGNLFRGNTAGERGGGLYTRSSADFDRNIFLYNNAALEGGGVFIWRDEAAVYRNTVIVGNGAPNGSGMYLWGAVSHFTHITINKNTGTAGNGVKIDRYPGLVDPGESAQISSRVFLTNTIVATQTVGLSLTGDNMLSMKGVLWHNVPTHAGYPPLTDVQISNEYSGNPDFMPDGYHLNGWLSPAIGKGIATLVDHDIDADLHLDGQPYTLGADAPIRIDNLPTLTPYLLTTNVSTIGMGITAIFPAGTFDPGMQMSITAKPASAVGCLPCTQASNDYWLGCSVCKMDPFADVDIEYFLNLDPYQNEEKVDPFPLITPVSLTFTYPESMIIGQREWELTAFFLENTPGSQARKTCAAASQVIIEKAACGPVKHDMVNNRLVTPICRLGTFGFGFPNTSNTLFLPMLFRN